MLLATGLTHFQIIATIANVNYDLDLEVDFSTSKMPLQTPSHVRTHS